MMRWLVGFPTFLIAVCALEQCYWRKFWPRWEKMLYENGVR